MRESNMILENKYQRKLTRGTRGLSEEASHELKTKGCRMNYMKNREDHFRDTKQYEQCPSSGREPRTLRVDSRLAWQERRTGGRVV